MKSLGTPASTQPSSDSFQKRLNTYALAATAAGIGALASAPADAEIVYTPAHVVIKVDDVYNLDLNQDGITDFFLKNVNRCNTDQCFYNLFEKAQHGNAAMGTLAFSGFPLFASALSAGAKIGPRQTFYKKVGWLATFYVGGGGYSSHGKWDNVKKRYLGLRFKINGEVHFGWARLNVQVLTHPVRIIGTLTGYAYETDIDKAILAGQMTDAASTPAPTTLGHLALGAQGRAKQPHRAVSR